jgi:hypothetical protein
MGLPPADHDPAEVRELADEILRQARYDVPPKSIPDRILEWLGEQLTRLIDGLVGGGGGAIVAWGILLGALAAVVYLLVRYGRVSLPALARDPEPEVMVELTRTAAAWRAEAEALESEGRWAEGLRCRYRALVADLVRRGTIGDQAGRTAGEYARDVAAREPALAPAFAGATELFEAVWYGGAVTGPAEADRFQHLERQVLEVRV